MKRRGFTLAELSIVIALSAVVLLAIASMVISMQSYSQARAADISRNSALSTVESRMNAWFSSVDSSNYPAPTVSGERELIFGGKASATFDSEGKELSLKIGGAGSETVSCPEVADITFACEGNLVKCTVTFHVNEESRTYSFLLLKRSVNSES